MYRQQVAFIINLIMLADGLIIILGGYAALYLRSRWGDGYWMLDGHLVVGIILFLMFVNNFVMGSLGLYSDQRAPSLWYTIKRVVAVVLIVFAILSAALLTLKLHDISRLFVGFYAALALAGFLIIRFFLEYFLVRIQARGFNVYQILIVGVGPRAEALARALMVQRSWGHQLIGLVQPDDGDHILCTRIPCLGCLDDLEQVLTEHSVDEIIFALEPECRRMIMDHLNLCEKFGITYKIIPALYDPSSPFRLQVEHIQGIPTISKQMITINAAGLFYKRVLDVGIGLVGMAIFCTLYPFIALAIKLDSAGPVIFKQKRMGQNGRIFEIYKFRTMYVDAEARKQALLAQNEMQGLMFKLRHDPRITRVGHFLRKTSLDEIPQFINVIKGEMSLVGTRPPTLDEVARYETWHRRRISMRPGLTGLWQVSGRNKINEFDEVVKLDLTYIDNWRFTKDLKIILLYPFTHP